MHTPQAYPDYREYTVHIRPEALPGMELDDIRSVVIAEMAEWGFESFAEEDEIIRGYIRADAIQGNPEETLSEHPAVLSCTWRLIEGENWNALWEQNFEPVEIPGRCRIRADFHPPDPAYPIELVITPKMSFGTGHHATTRLMAEALLDLQPAGKRVLDMGCGTGILALLAARLGASEVVAIDNDPQCILNATENFRVNGIRPDAIYLLGQEPPLPSFDLILANIHRNVLLEQMPWYASHLVAGGVLLVSGIHPEDREDLTTEAARNGLKFDYFKGLNDWIMMRFGR